MRSIRCLQSGIFLGMFILTLAASASADVLILESDVSDYKAGTVVRDGQTVNIPEGRKIKFIGEDGVYWSIQESFRVPFEGQRGSRSRVREGNRGLGEVASRLLKKWRPISDKIGGTRKTASRQPALVMDPWHISVDESGDRCIRALNSVVLYRSDDSMDRQIWIFFDPNGSGVTWRKGSKELALPDEPAFMDGRTYRIEHGGLKVELKFHVMPDGISDPAQQARWLSEENCNAQAFALLQQIHR